MFKGLLEELECVREHKIQEAIRTADNKKFIEVSGITSYEINKRREHLSSLLLRMHKLEEVSGLNLQAATFEFSQSLSSQVN